jgi:hypothetical protein
MTYDMHNLEINKNWEQFIVAMVHFRAAKDQILQVETNILSR